MKKIKSEEVRKIELDLLLDFVDFCDKHKLTYFLAYGTLLGAVRHKGFIPWDDDVDVFMPREDYNRLREMYNEKKENEFYVAVDPESDIAKHTIVKIMDTRTIKKENGLDYKKGYLGVDIDIFPLDGVPADEEEFRKWHKKLIKYYLKHLYKELRFSGTFARNLKMFIQKIVYGCYVTSLKKVFSETKALHELYPYEESEYAGCFETYCMEDNNRLKREWFKETVLLDFEGYKMKAPKDYHQVLTKLYGDYMKLPPEEMRVTHHGNNMFWKEKEE